MTYQNLIITKLMSDLVKRNGSDLHLTGDTVPYFRIQGSILPASGRFQNNNTFAQENQSANDKLGVGCIGLGGRGTAIARQALKLGTPIVACDVDKNRLELAREIVKGWHGKAPLGAGDYRKIIDDPKIDVVHISTPDHWHAKIAIEAMLAGKDVYCEKPMTLTIEEGRLICDQDAGSQRRRRQHPRAAPLQYLRT